MNPIICAISAESLQIAELLRTVAVGECIAYETMTAAIKRDVQHKGRPCLETARRLVQREDAIVFAPIRGVGLKRLTDGELAQTGAQTLRRVNSTAKRGIKKLSCVKDFNSLTNEEKIKHNTAVSLLGVFYEVSKSKGVKHIEAAVSVVQRELPLKDALRAFLGTAA